MTLQWLTAGPDDIQLRKTMDTNGFGEERIEEIK